MFRNFCEFFSHGLRFYLSSCFLCTPASQVNILGTSHQSISTRPGIGHQPLASEPAQMRSDPLGGLPLHWSMVLFGLPRLRFCFRLYPASVSRFPGVGSFAVLHLFSSVRTHRSLLLLLYTCLSVWISELGCLTLCTSHTSRSDS